MFIVLPKKKKGVFSDISTGRQATAPNSLTGGWPFELSRVLTITVHGGQVASLAHIANS